jgi:hypothetical protein
MTEHNAHVYAFWNAPLSQRQAWTRGQMAEIATRLKAGGYPSADAYYWDKDEYWRLKAGLVGKSEREVNPMGFWFGRQSN